MDVAVATEALQCVVGVLNAPFGQASFGDRGEEADQGMRTFALGRVAGVFGHIQQRIGVQTEQAATFHQ